MLINNKFFDYIPLIFIGLIFVNENEMEVDFFIDFEFQSASFQFLFQSAFEEVVKRMIIAFEKRAGEIYR